MMGVMEVPAELDAHIESFQGGELRLTDLGDLGTELRSAALKSLMPQHPQLSAGLNKIGFDSRRHTLRWAKNRPRRADAMPDFAGHP
jgi:hypothetical protein